MRYERAPELTCPACIHTAMLKGNAVALQRLIAGALPDPPTTEATSLEPSPDQDAATAWLLAIGACLRRDVENHPACKACGILLGPGHLELGKESYCGTCYNTRRDTTEPDTARRTYGTSVFGVRGWLRDQPRRR